MVIKISCPLCYLRCLSFEKKAKLLLWVLQELNSCFVICYCCLLDCFELFFFHCRQWFCNVSINYNKHAIFWWNDHKNSLITRRKGPLDGLNPRQDLFVYFRTVDPNHRLNDITWFLFNDLLAIWCLFLDIKKVSSIHKKTRKKFFLKNFLI